MNSSWLILALEVEFLCGCSYNRLSYRREECHTASNRDDVSELSPVLPHDRTVYTCGLWGPR